MLPAIFVFLFFNIEYYLRTAGYGSKAGSIFTFETYNIFSGIFLLQLLLYIIVSFNLLKNYKKNIKTIYSSIEKIDLQWLQWLLVLYSFHWFFDLLMPLQGIFQVEISNLQTTLEILSILTLLTFSTLIVINGLKQIPVTNGFDEKPKYADSYLSKSESVNYSKKLITYMNTDKPYLNPTLKINDLASSLSIPAKSLSQSINQELGKNFFDLVNEYRINEAKSKITELYSNNKTILEILYDSGFNSKAAFNRAFKKHTGLTPTEFKNQYQEQLNVFS